MSFSSTTGMNCFVARSAQGYSVANFVPKINMRRPWLDMMRIEISALLTALLTSVFITVKNALSPQLVVVSIACCKAFGPPAGKARMLLPSLEVRRCSPLRTCSPLPNRRFPSFSSLGVPHLRKRLSSSPCPASRSVRVCIERCERSLALGLRNGAMAQGVSKVLLPFRACMRAFSRAVLLVVPIQPLMVLMLCNRDANVATANFALDGYTRCALPALMDTSAFSRACEGISTLDSARLGVEKRSTYSAIPTNTCAADGGWEKIKLGILVAHSMFLALCAMPTAVRAARRLLYASIIPKDSRVTADIAMQSGYTHAIQGA